MAERDRLIRLETPRERAFLVAVDTGAEAGWSAEESLTELAALADTAGADVVGAEWQRRRHVDPAWYLGKGKAQELVEAKGETGFALLVADDELTPNQQRSLEGLLNCKVLDRSGLILDIFSQHAQTHEGRLQVELAQLEYQLPRLTRLWTHLSRTGGGIGTRGPGETQLETDRRILQRKIHRLKKQIDDIRKHRQLYRQQRKKTGIPIVALVGYTNAGKSTLLNALSNADVFVEDKLFATLDPTTRRLTLPNKSTVLLTDTVGFIRKLPPTIISAFKATLEELTEASLLLHVVDLTSHNAAEQCQVVEDILADLELLDKPRITALNKIDMLMPAGKQWGEKEALKNLSDQAPADEDTVLVSAVRGWGLGGLLEQVGQVLNRSKQPV